MFGAIGDIRAIIETVGSLVGRFIPDPAKAAEAKVEIEKLLIEASTAQMQINMKEAEHASLFVAGWRPFVGWVCGIGCAYSFIAHPFLTWISVTLGGKPFISLDTASMIALLSGMLGLGAIRTYEKVQEVARTNGIKMPWGKK